MSKEAASILSRMKSYARSLRTLALNTPDIIQTNVNTGVAAEVAALSAGSLVPGESADTDTTKEEFENFILTVTQFQNFYNNVGVSTQNNASFTQNLLQGA